MNQRNSFERNDLASSSKYQSLDSNSPQKVTALLKALDEILGDDGKDDLMKHLGKDAFNKCSDLQSSIRRGSSQPPITSPLSQRPDKLNIPKSLPATSITPWTSSSIPKSMPPLPPILDKTLEEATFRHVNTGTGHFTDLTYERLEWVGDAYIELTATLLISQTFPILSPGKSSQMRERLVKNQNLARYSKHYGFDLRAQLGTHPEVRDPDKMVKVHGDIFEAYVAAIILSDPQNGVARATAWLKDLFGMVLREDIAAEERKEEEYQNPMWNLGIAVPDTSKEDKLNMKDRLQKALGAKGIKITYQDEGEPTKDRNSKLPLYTVGIYLTGWGENNKQLGFGSALGKKEAGMKAAGMALGNKRLMAPLLEKKRMHDEQLALERKALEKAGVVDEKIDTTK
ncbi:ribonuclease III domain-containing protein [Tricladium varicosporioides]|nr:ribonuclease III domain-containing protein [Hymenoscyphus varicosporioides]